MSNSHDDLRSPGEFVFPRPHWEKVGIKGGFVKKTLNKKPGFQGFLFNQSTILTVNVGTLSRLSVKDIAGGIIFVRFWQKTQGSNFQHTNYI